MGGVQSEIPIPYGLMMLKQLTLRGAFMYPRHAPGDVLRMITAGTLKLDVAVPHVFPLKEINTAVVEAARLKGLNYCVVNP